MNTNKLSPDQIISGTESGYIFDLPEIKKPLMLWQKIWPNKHEALLLEREHHPHVVNKIIEVLSNTQFYWQLTIDQVRQLYTFTNTDYSKADPMDLIHGENFFERGY